jgi:mRNA-binding protein PUF3
MAPTVPIGSPPVTTAALDSSTSAFKYASKFSEYADTGDAGPFMAHELERRFALSVAAQRQAQEASSSSAVGNGPSRHLASARPEPSLNGQLPPFRDLSYTAPASSAIHSQRPSLAGPSFPTHNAVSFDQSVAQQTQDQVAESLGMMGLDSGPNGTPNGALSSALNGALNGSLNGASYSNGQQNFQFNPGTQPWESYAASFAREAFANGTAFEKRGSLVGRNSPAGSTYQGTGGLNSPKSFTGTPQPNGDAWSRPVSRNPRMSSDLDRRGLGQYFAQPSAAPFHPNGFYSQNYPQLQPPYGAYADPRHNPHMTGYGVSIPPYSLQSGSIPTRPARDQDPGKNFRSRLLDEFLNSKSTKGWELKVRSCLSIAQGRPRHAMVD